MKIIAFEGGYLPRASTHLNPVLRGLRAGMWMAGMIRKIRGNRDRCCRITPRMESETSAGFWLGGQRPLAA